MTAPDHDGASTAAADTALTAALAEGQAHHRAGRLAAAEQAYRQLLTGRPDHAPALRLLGTLALQLGRGEEAVALLRRSLALAPDDATAYANLAAALGSLGRVVEAVDAARSAVRLRPGFAQAYNNLGVALEQAGRPAEAVAAYGRAVALDPRYAEAHNHLGNALRRLGRLGEAEAAHRRALALSPALAPAWNNLAATLAELGRADDAVACYRRLVRLRPASAGDHSDLLVALHYPDGVDPAALAAEHRRWAARHAAPLYPAAGRPYAGGRDPDRVLRVGYVSPDFRDHPAARFFEPVLRHHDRGRFEVFCYSDAAPDGTTDRLRGLAAGGWRDVRGLPDAAVSERVRADGIDVLVDLAGHMANPRLLVFARRPAPVQAAYIGYPNTTGLATMDYRVVDALTDPPGGPADALCTERPVRLDGCCWCWQPDQDESDADRGETPAPAPGNPPARADGGHPITFGVMNRPVKMTPRMVGLWAEVLRRVPGSRLLVLAGHGVPGEPPVPRWFVAHGVDEGRVVVAGRRPRRQYLALYDEVDVALDTFPYNGMTTTCDALWMGVPVVTLAGPTHVSRAGLSLLSAAGLADLVAADPAGYVAAAVGLARDPARLAELRRTLRDRLRRSDLLDGSGLTRRLEAAYRDMWGRYCAGTGSRHDLPSPGHG